MAFLGIDIGGTFIKYAVIEGGEVISKSKVSTPKADYFQFLNEIEKIILENSKDIEGIGVSLPGKVNCDTGVVEHGGALPYLHMKNIKEEINKIINLPVRVENDGNAATLAEYNYGNLKGVKNGGAIILGTGVGSAYILDGVLRKGEHFQCGEISFMIQDKGLCGTDSFIAYKASAVMLIKKLADILSLEPDGKKVFEEIESKEEALNLLKEYCRNIALLIYNVQTVLDLERYVIGGGISSQTLLIKYINEGYDDIYKCSPIINKTFIRPEILEAKFREDANLIGVTCS